MYAKKPKGNVWSSKFSILYIILFAPPEVIHSCGAFGLLVFIRFFSFLCFSALCFSFLFLSFYFGHGLFLERKGSYFDHSLMNVVPPYIFHRNFVYLLVFNIFVYLVINICTILLLMCL